MKPSLFKALSSEVRLSLVKELLKNKTLCVCALSAKMDRDISTVSRHIKQLKLVGLVSTKRKGKEIRVSLKNPELTKKFFTDAKKLGVKK